MTINVTSPVTGSSQTGLTSPTYTVVVDTPPDAAAKSYAVTALGGTQTGVTTHSVQSPFTLTFWRPKFFQALKAVVGQVLLINNVPRNTWSLVTRKGVTVFSGQPPIPMVIKTVVDVPAGADLADAPNIRACFSAHIGALNQQSAGLGDSATSGIFG